MKKLKTILILIIIASSFQLVISPALAQDDPPESLNFIPQITIPGSIFEESEETIVGQSYTETDQETSREKTIMSSTLLPRYIKAIYKYGIGISSFLALIMIVAGGLIWLTSAGSPDKIGKAKSIITSSIIGLVLLLGTYTMAQLVNPALLNFKPIKTEYIGATKTGCCEITEGDDVKAIISIKNECNQEEESTFYPGHSPNKERTECLANGCCFIEFEVETTYNTGGTVPSSSTNTHTKSQCTFVNNQICSDPESFDTGSGWNLGSTQVTRIKSNDFFENTICEEVEECEGHIEEPCKNKADDNHCSGIENCWCYGGAAYHGHGKEGEPCGDGDSNARCYSLNNGPQTDSSGCDNSNNWYNDHNSWVGGDRNCESGLKCCYYNP